MSDLIAKGMKFCVYSEILEPAQIAVIAYTAVTFNLALIAWAHNAMVETGCWRAG